MELFYIKENIQCRFMLSSIAGSNATERPKVAPFPAVAPEGKLIKKGWFSHACSNLTAV